MVGIGAVRLNPPYEARSASAYQHFGALANII